MIALPLIYSVYLGVAESGRDIALGLAKRKPRNQHAVNLAGRMETELTAARLAHQSMVSAVRLNAPSATTVNQVMIGRQLVVRPRSAPWNWHWSLPAAQASTGTGLERRFRDIQAARYHPLQSGHRPDTPGQWRWGYRLIEFFDHGGGPT